MLHFIPARLSALTSQSWAPLTLQGCPCHHTPKLCTLRSLVLVSNSIQKKPPILLLPNNRLFLPTSSFYSSWCHRIPTFQVQNLKSPRLTPLASHRVLLIFSKYSSSCILLDCLLPSALAQTLIPSNSDDLSKYFAAHPLTLQTKEWVDQEGTPLLRPVLLALAMSVGGREVGGEWGQGLTGVQTSCGSTSSPRHNLAPLLIHLQEREGLLKNAYGE